MYVFDPVFISENFNFKKNSNFFSIKTVCCTRIITQ